MRNNALTTILIGVLTLSALLSVFFCLQFIMISRELRSLSSQAAQINAYRAGVSALANDCVAYSEKNHAIDPILESVGYKKPNPTKQPGTR